MNRVLEISCLLIIWTKIDWGMTINTSTVSYREEDFLKTPVLKNLTTEGFIQELREEKENSGDENVRNVFPLKGKIFYYSYAVAVYIFKVKLT
ncbi:hypothetical protein RUM43_002021 [Polyplax serrata]|uniref:Uncharacterized protein n=1 Tax=Polyplax serrata TaxID=468196 RepID=A0AAN8S5P6_POLSC